MPGADPGLVPAGWPLRHFEVDELGSFLESLPARLIEISKDQIRDSVSIKALGRTLDHVRASTGAELAFAGTTDLVQCAGMPWERYRAYLAVQIAQARFLGCSYFRILVGDRAPEVTEETLLARMADLVEDLGPMTACIEIHGGIESEPEVLDRLLAHVPVQIVVDFENMQRAGLTSEELHERVPGDRIAYFHQRSLPGVWREHPESEPDEARWSAWYPNAVFLWEPKKVEMPSRIRELDGAYRKARRSREEESDGGR